MKSTAFVFGLIFLGYFQLFALDCPHGQRVHLEVYCQSGNQQLSLTSFKGTFLLNKIASNELLSENSDHQGFVCVYSPENYKAIYSYQSQNIVIENLGDIIALVDKLTEEDPNFPNWYAHIESLLEPEFRHIEGVSMNGLLPPKKYNLKIGLGMNFNGKIALEKQTGSYRLSSNYGIDPDSSLYIIAQQCAAQISSDKIPQSEVFYF